ncbi:hypothetical protein GCM10023346_28490 [Arthrobacter gyeryongensis]|uniref:Uncharacterized protein n=1 Tax=Arthrobacter gyeryongensis TaxID=1650592 RepID=A0ABP9SKL6_9MICC
MLPSEAELLLTVDASGPLFVDGAAVAPLPAPSASKAAAVRLSRLVAKVLVLVTVVLDIEGKAAGWWWPPTDGTETTQAMTSM